MKHGDDICLRIYSVYSKINSSFSYDYGDYYFHQQNENISLTWSVKGGVSDFFLKHPLLVC